MDLKKLLTRTLSGVIYCAIIILCIFWGTSAVTIMASLFAVLAVIEFTKMTTGRLQGRIIPLLLDIAGTVCLCCSTSIYPIAFWIIVMICRFVVELYMKDDNPLRSLGVSALSQLYIGIPLGCMVAIADLSARTEALLAVFLFLWINDTGAFLTGSLFGRHKLFERISPKKSWEGFIGGYLFNLIAAALFAIYCPHFFEFGLYISNSIGFWLGLATVVTVFGTWGDLVESLMKRTMHIKDSGHLIPGHGGILDRIDSLLLAAPAVLVYMLFTEMLL